MKKRKIVATVSAAAVGGNVPPPLPTDAWAKLRRPSKPEAAYYLRLLSVGLGSTFSDSDILRWRVRLALIAECIEGRSRFRKATALSVSEQQEIQVYARGVTMRDAGVSVQEAIDALALQFARSHGLGDKQAKHRIAPKIAEAHKQQRKITRSGK